MLVARSRIVGTFDQSDAARTCFSQLHRGQVFRPSTTLWVKPSHSLVEIGYSAKDARASAARGLVLGGAVGFGSGLLLGFLVVQLTGASSAMMWLAAALGMLVGSIVGAVFAPSMPPQSLGMLDGDDPLALTVETTESEDREWAADLLTRGHAHVERRPTTLEEQTSTPPSLRPA